MSDYLNSRMEREISERIHNETHRLILKLRLVDGWTYEKIAAHPDVDRTPRQIGYIISRHAPKLIDLCQKIS